MTKGELMDTGRLKLEALKVRDLVSEYRGGRIVIPEFQRDYVWRRGKAPKLIDSLYRGFPISSLLLWQSAEKSVARRRDPRPDRSSGTSWLIDGQQRVITLARTIAGDEGIEVMFNPDEDMFRLANAAIRRDRNWFRAADIWDNESYRALRRNLDSGNGFDQREARFEKVREILDYEVPLVRMIDHSFNNAVTAFQRINTLGVKLREADIESAKVAAKHTGFIASKVIPFLEEIRRDGFTRINVMHLFRACAFIATPDGRARTPLHELSNKEVENAWHQTEIATKKAIGLIRGDLGLVNMDILWSGALIVPIIALCAIVPAKSRDGKAMIGWLAMAALYHRYSFSPETALDQDLRACRTKDPIGGLLSNLRQTRSSIVATPKDFSGALNDRSGLLASYIACLNRGILDFYTGDKILLQHDVHRHHILPRAQFEIEERATADNVANIAFIAGDVNQAISHSGPEVYLKKMPERILISQCVPLERSLWKIEEAEAFWAERRTLLAKSFNEFVKEALPNRKIS
jgi:hypothetical protein